MSSPSDHDEFVLLLIGAQSRLYAYILSLVLNRDRARDILQQTNLVLLEKESDFETGTNFAAWAYRVAFYEVLSDRRTQKREKLLFSDELLTLIAAKGPAIEKHFDERVTALEACMREITSEQRDLLMQRYRPDGSVAKIAAQLKKSPAAVSAMLYRLRVALVSCVEHKLKGMASS